MTTTRAKFRAEPATTPRPSPSTARSTPPVKGRAPQSGAHARDPEALDELVHVTNRHGWLALAAIALVVVAALGWSIFARIPQQITVNGVVRSGNNVTVASAVEGRVSGLEVAPGDEVTKGQPVVVITPFDGGDDVTVEADAPGIVRETYVNLGDGVDAGEALAVIRPDGGTADQVRVVAYVSPLVSRDFGPGSTISVQVPDISRGTTQVVAATVDRIGAVPTTREGIAAEVEDEDLAEALFTEADGSPYRVDLRLKGSGKVLPGSEIYDGQVAAVTVTYDNPHPIELLFGN